MKVAAAVAFSALKASIGGVYAELVNFFQYSTFS
jgi:hypothetical protein